jgi:hypothetical protein
VLLLFLDVQVIAGVVSSTDPLTSGAISLPLSAIETQFVGYLEERVPSRLT